MATSFPYLAIAKRHGVSYGSVIRFAETLETARPDSWMAESELEREIALAWINERQRREAHAKV